MEYSQEPPECKVICEEINGGFSEEIYRGAFKETPVGIPFKVSLETFLEEILEKSLNNHFLKEFLEEYLE